MEKVLEPVSFANRDQKQEGRPRNTESKMIEEKPQPHQPSPIEPQLLLSSFFVDKKSQLSEEATFKSILEIPQISNRTFKTKIASNNSEI